MPNTYRYDYPQVPIGGSNPYHMCARCGRSAPEINGDVGRHDPSCSWRQEQERAATERSNTWECEDCDGSFVVTASYCNPVACPFCGTAAIRKVAY
jgi:hypothetical protein